MTLRETNGLGEAFQILSHLWRHRKSIAGYQKDIRLPGGIVLFADYEVPAKILDTIDALFGDDLKPILLKANRSPTGWYLIFSIPAGGSFRQVLKYQDRFEDFTNSTVIIERKYGQLHFTVFTTELKPQYPYEWDPRPWLNTGMLLPFPLGWTVTGLKVVDLAKVIAFIVAGLQGSGKSNFLQQMVWSFLLAAPAPRSPRIAIIDCKRSEFGYLKDHVPVAMEVPHAATLLKALNRELNVRLGKLERARVRRWQQYRGDDMPPIILIIDELGEVIEDECMDLLNRLLRLGRAPGIHICCATQRPSSTMFKKFGDSKALLSGTLAFKVRDDLNSRMLLDNDAAAFIPNNPGRAVWQWGVEQCEVQVMCLPEEQADELLAGLGQQRSVDVVERSPKRLPAR